MKTGTVIAIGIGLYLLFGGKVFGANKFDLNGDGKVDGVDLGLFKSVYGMPATYSALAKRADFNGDGMVDINDYGELVVYMGAHPM